MNLPLLCAVFGILGFYVLGFLWIKRIRTKEQVHIGATVIPHRSYYRKPHHYFLLFYTGSGRHAGTTANVYCVIHGKQKKTKPIILRDPERLLFQSGTMTSFLLTLNKSLDQITKLHLWHDISGPKPSWFLERVVICHLNTGLMWHFEANRWLDVSENDGSVECIIHALPRSQYLRRKTLFDKQFSDNFKNRHIWFSPFKLKTRTLFSRYERFASCLGVSMVTLLNVTVAMNSRIHGDSFPSSVVMLGPLSFKLSDIMWGVVCSIIPCVFRLVLEFLFTYPEEKGTLPLGENDVQRHIDECLEKAMEITFLDGQSNTCDDEQGDKNEDSSNSMEEDGSEMGFRMRGNSLVSESGESQFMEEAWSEVSLDMIGLDLANQNDIQLMANPVPNSQPETENQEKKERILTEDKKDSPIPNGISNTISPGLQKELTGHDKKPIVSNGACVKDSKEESDNKDRVSPKPEQANFAYSNSLTNVDRIPRLWKMIPLPGFLVDPNCVRIRNTADSFKLPGRFLYVALFTCVVVSLTAPMVCILYGFSWSPQTTISWLMTMLFALVFQILVAETFWVFFQSIYFAVYLQRTSEENDIVYEQRNRVWAKEEDDARYYVDDLDDTSSSVPRPPDEEEVKKAREKAGQDRQLEEVLLMVAFDVIFLLQLVIISFGNRDAMSYPMRTVVENNYNAANFTARVTNTRTFWAWTKTNLVTGLYYEGKFKQKASRQTGDGYGTLLGVPILRQQRIKSTGTCEHSETAKLLFTQCNIALPQSGDHEEQNFYPRWKLKPGHHDTSPLPWRYKTGSQSNTQYTTYARMSSYGSGGYIASLGYNKTSALKILEELESLNWVDRYTRVVLIEFATYNGNINILSDIVFAVEFTAFGGAFPRFDHFSFRLYRYFTPLQLGYLVCEVIFVVFTAQLVYKILCDIHEHKMTYFKSFWNYTDMVLAIASLITIGLYAVRELLLQEGIGAIQANPELFFGFYAIALYDNLVAFMSCIVVIVPVIQFLKFLKFNKSFMIFDATLKLIMPDVAGFTVIFVISLFAFAFWAFHMLGNVLESYSTFIGAFNSVLSMLLGKFSFRVFSPGESQALGPFYTYVFTIVNVFFILTIILCIITIGFTEARKDASLQKSKYEIVKFITDRTKDVLGLNPPYIPPKPVIKVTPVDYAEIQLRLNTRYVLQSQVSRLLRFANGVYSEDAIDDIEIIERILGLDNGAEYLSTITRKRMEEKEAHKQRHEALPDLEEESNENDIIIDDLTEEMNKYDPLDGQTRRHSTLSTENECSRDFIA